MRLYSARQWQRLGWHGRERVRLSRLVTVAQLEREHTTHFGVDRCRVRGALNQQQEARTA